MDSNKVQILLTVYTATQESLKDMRARVLSISSTSITFFTVFVGWIVQKPTKPSLQETLLFVAVVLVFWLCNLRILVDIRRGFVSTLGTTLRVEKALMLHESNQFNCDNEPLLPSGYQKPKTGRHFKKFELTLSASAIAAILILLLKYILG